MTGAASQRFTGHRTVRARSWVEPAATAWSAVTATAGALWLAVPGSYPDQLTRRGAEGSLVGLLDPPVVSAVLLVLGSVGVVAAVTAQLAPIRSGRWPVPFATAYFVVFCLLATDERLLTVMGYSAAILGPPAVLAVLVVAAAHRRVLLLPVAGFVVAGTLAVTVGDLDLTALTTLGRDLVDGLGRSGAGTLLVLASFAGGALWLLVALRAAGLRWAPRPSAGSYVAARRGWGWWVTVAAAAGPLPYGLVRMTWLTPWPVFDGGALLDAHPAVRGLGVTLGLAAITGSVLTVGLLSRWGSVYPRWMPGLGGRPVSPVWPTALASTVGIAMTVSGRSVTQMSVTDPMAIWLMALPFTVCGPLLVVAAVAYYRRRTASPTASANTCIPVTRPPGSP